MEHVSIAALFASPESHTSQEITVVGWVRSIRDMKNFGFVTINDGTCFKDLQVVMDRESLNDYDAIAAQNVGAALIAHGTLVLTPEAPQPFELKYILDTFVHGRGADGKFIYNIIPTEILP